MCGSTKPTSQWNLLLRKIVRKQTKRINNWYWQNITNTWTFSAKKKHTVSPNQDLGITKPKLFKKYNLTLAEQIKLDKFLKENLEKGYIQPSQSPMASPFFFVSKKDGKLRPCQDYRYLNDWMVKNFYPLPLISEIMDKLKGAKYFTKLDVHWGYNNVQIRKEDEWKAAFKTNKGLFEPTVMFSGMCNFPAIFQAMMDDIFMTIIDSRLVIVYMDDIFIFADTKEELERVTKLILEKL
jgi:Reverse transcriptase (RNA-dependent DNA polymerase)